MAMICVRDGETFFGYVIVEIDDKSNCRIISWDNVERVYDEDYKKDVME